MAMLAASRLWPARPTGAAPSKVHRAPRDREASGSSWPPAGGSVLPTRCSAHGRRVAAEIELSGRFAAARVLITGSADGLGLMAAQRLADQGHRATLHARTQAAVPRAEGVVVG